MYSCVYKSIVSHTLLIMTCVLCMYKLYKICRQKRKETNESYKATQTIKQTNSANNKEAVRYKLRQTTECEHAKQDIILQSQTLQGTHQWNYLVEFFTFKTNRVLQPYVVYLSVTMLYFVSVQFVAIFHRLLNLAQVTIWLFSLMVHSSVDSIDIVSGFSTFEVIW